MILENACEYKDYLGNVFDELGFNGSFEVVDNRIHLNIIPSENQETPTKEQVLEKLKEVTFKQKKQEIEAKINAICKEKIIKGFRSEVLGSLHAYDLTLEDQANLQALVVAGIDSVFRCAEVDNNGVLWYKTYKKHTKAQILQLSKEALKFKQNLIIFYGREKERLKAITSLEAITQAKTNANNEISENKTQAITNINEAKTNANNEISENKTQAITNINEAKESATTQINANKQEVLNNITQEKQQATSEINEAKKTAFNELLETLKPKFSGLFVGAYYIRNVIYIQGGWEQKVKDLSDYTLEKSKKGE
ncbi:DUF1542 domain-containing protein [Helicobacter pylori]|uniref:DUF1542 domain-containing protein n=1 Tax=Helicobacter pylori TaxID=210 RepID=UPI000FDEB5BB|nr:DUF1542 domain-containing protein [Helicobacter pylori]RVZ60095.1 DUF1542 domain-containing protein [Helicobacter pylori]